MACLHAGVWTSDFRSACTIAVCNESAAPNGHAKRLAGARKAATERVRGECLACTRLAHVRPATPALHPVAPPDLITHRCTALRSALRPARQAARIRPSARPGAAAAPRAPRLRVRRARRALAPWVVRSSRGGSNRQQPHRACSQWSTNTAAACCAARRVCPCICCTMYAAVEAEAAAVCVRLRLARGGSSLPHTHTRMAQLYRGCRHGGGAAVWSVYVAERR